MNITLKEAVDGFRKQWNWIADETLKQKRRVEKFEYFDEQDIDPHDTPWRDCYLCEFSRSVYIGHQCDKCPIEWGGKIGDCYHKNTRGDYRGLYVRWIKAADYKEAARLAREIANLPLKEKYREEYERSD